MSKQLTRLLALVLISVAFLGLNRTSAQVLIHYWSFGKGSPAATGPKYNGGPTFPAPWVINSSTTGFYSTPGTAKQVGIKLNPGDSMVKADEDLHLLNSNWLHINADYSALDSTKAQIGFAARYTAGRKTSYYNYYTYIDTVSAGSNVAATHNLQTTPHGTPYPGEGLRLRNPSDSVEMLVWMPTTGYKNISFSWEVSNSSPTSGVPAITYAYSTDSGKTFKTTLFTSTPGFTIPRSVTENDINATATYTTNDKTRDTILDDGNSDWNVKTIDFTNDTSVNNKPGFVIRIQTVMATGTKGKNITSKGNLRMDNFALKGTPTHLFGSITKLQTGAACVTSAASAADSLQISFGPAAAFTGSNFVVQLSDSLGSFTSSSNIGSFAASSTGSQTINWNIPAGYYSATGNYKVRVLYPGVDTFPSISITNISYSPQNVSSVTTTNGFNTGTIIWGTPGGCFYDNILVVVSSKTTATVPSGTSYTANTVYGSGSALNGGYVVYSGTSVNTPITITNVKNDSIYYVTVYTLYGTTWSKGVRAALAPTPYVPVHYWNFNNTSTWSVSSAVTPSSLISIRANYSAIDTGLTKISYVTIPGTSTNYKTYYDAVTPGTSLNARLSATAGIGLRLHNPSDSMQLLVAMATTGYKRMKLKFAIERNATGSTLLSYSFSTNGGTTWKTTGMSTTSDLITTSWANSSEITFTDTTVNNNPNFVFRITSANNNTGTTGNYSLDNVSLDGVYEGNYNKNTTITKFQSGNVCITKVINAKDSIYFNYSPKTSVPKGTTFTAQISDSFGSFATPVNIGTVISDTSGSQVIVGTVPAATRNARNNYIRVISSIDSSSPKLVTNIVYSPAAISFVSATNGNTSSYINWGTPGGCYYDDVVIVVSRNPISGTPSATSYAGNPVYGHGSSLLGGYVLYFGSHTNSTYKVTGLKNDSLYYAAVYVLKGTEWSTGVTTIFTPTFSQLVHYWHFNNFNSGITAATSPAVFTPYRADYTLIDTATAHVAYQKLPGTSNHYKTYWAANNTGGTLNDQTLAGIGTIPAGKCVHLPNPVDSMGLIVYAPTQGYKNIKFVYEATNSSLPTGVPNAVYNYTTDSGLTWKAVPDTWVTPRPIKAGCDSIIYNSAGLMTLHSIDFTNDSTVGHNPKFAIRITTKVNGVTGINGSNGAGGSTSGGWYVDNFTISGKPLSGSIGIASYQVSKVCVTNTVAGLDTIGFYYNPVTYFNGIKFTVQLSEPNGDFVTPTTIATVTSNGSGSQKVVATIPAGTKNSSYYAIRVISSIGDGTPFGISNISYSPGDVSSLNACGGNHTATIQWGAPTGCYNDSVLVVVSTKTITAVPTGTGSTYTPNTVFGSGASFGGGSVVYRGNGNQGTIFVSNLKNDSTYYVHVFTGYQSVWGAGLEVTVNPTLKHTTLCPGDIVSLGMSPKTSSDTMFFAPLVDLDSATTFFITNRSYNGSSLAPGRGVIKVTVTKFIPAGTTIYALTGCAYASGSASCLRYSSSNFIPSTKGEYNLIFTGDTGVGQQNYISALSELSYSPGNSATNGSGDHTTGLPYGLSLGTTAFTMNQSASGTATNQIYSGSYIGDKATILNNMGKGSGVGTTPGADWTTNNTTTSVNHSKNLKLAVRPDGNVSNFTVDTTQYVYYSLNLNWKSDTGYVKATHFLIAMDSVSLNNITTPSDSSIFIHNPRYVLKTRTKSNSTNERYTWSGLTGGKKYYFKIFPVNMGTAYNGNATSAYSLYTPVADSGIPTISPIKPTAAMSSSAALTNCAPNTFTLPVNFTGSAPWILTYNNGTKDTTITTSSNPYNIVVYVKTTATFTLKTVFNYNGHNQGTIGTATRSVDILSNASRSVTPSNSTVCSGGSQMFTLSSYNAATTVKWYYNTNPLATSSTWTLFGTNADTATLSPITSNVYVHAVVSATGCATVSSSDAIVKVDSASKLVAGTITSTSVALSWTSVVGATGYTIHYGSSTATSSSTSYTLTGLTPCTAYSIYVSPNTSACSVGNSNTVSITTAPTPINLTLDTSGTKVKAHWNGVKGNIYKLYVGTLSTLPTTTVFIVKKDTAYTIDFSKSTGYKGQTLYAYVVLDSGSNCSTKPVSNTAYLNVKGGCNTAAPSSLSATSTANSISLSWTGSASNYAVFYKTVSGSSWREYNVSSTSYTISNLAVNTPYVVFITNFCSISPYVYGYSSSLDTISTQKPCTTPNNLVLSNAKCHGFIAAWNSVSGISNYSIYYTRTTGSGAPTSFSYRSATNTQTITSLSSGTTYTVYVKANCSTGGQSSASNTETITTQAIGCKDEVIGLNGTLTNASSFNVYPNPNTGNFVVNMTTTALAPTATVEVLNVLGQLVYTQVIGNNSGLINVSIDLNSKAAGLYIVRVRCGNDVQDAKVQITR